MALLLVLPASAEPPGRPALRTRARLDALPVEARAELRKLYFRYVDVVSQRLDQGWKEGVLTEAVIEDVDEPFQPARLLAASVQKRQQEVSSLEKTLAKAPPDAPEHAATLRRLNAKKSDLKAAETKLGREKGLCRDWSDMIWSEITTLNPSYWAVEDRRRQARPFHTGAVLCASQEDDSHPACLVFDPWEEGKPEVFAFEAWDSHDLGGKIPADYFLHVLPEKAP